LGTLLGLAYQAGRLTQRIDEQAVTIDQLKVQQESILRREIERETKLGDLKCEIRKNSLTRFAAECIEGGGDLVFEGLYCLNLGVSGAQQKTFEDPLPEIQRSC
jgi:hypothetical protein